MAEVWLGGVVVIAAAAVFAVRLFRVSSGRVLRRLLTPAARRGVMAVLSLISGLAVLPALVPALRRGLFAFCAVCPIAMPAATEGTEHVGLINSFLLAAWYYAATVLPVFVLACLISGLLMAHSDRFRVRGVLGAFGLAAVLPVCSCGVVPLAKTMIDRGGSAARDGLVFLATAPLLSPVIIFLGLTMLGPWYTGVRVVASLAMALAVAFVIRPLVPTPGAGGGGRSRVSAPVTCGADGDAREEAVMSVLSSGWSFLTGLVRYVLYGVVLGSAVTAALPPEYVGAILRTGPLSLATAVVVGVPINMCAGEEILLASPLVGMGFTMGHAIAFSIASTGICVSSVPLLAAVLGKRATLAMVLLYLVVPFAIGLLVNVLPPTARFGPAPF